MGIAGHRPSEAVDILLIGDAAATEFEPLWSWLKKHVPRPSSLRAARPCCGGHDSSPDAVPGGPHLVVVLQSWSGQYARSDVAEWLACWPLARWVVCCGLWCESEGRHGSVWPGAVRVAAREARARIALELDVIAGRREPLPWTAARDESFGFEQQAPHSFAVNDSRDRRIAVESPDPTYRELLRDTIRLAGHRLVQTAPDLIVWDLDPWNRARQATLKARQSGLSQSVAQSVGGSVAKRREIPVVGVTSWETTTLRAEARRAGVTRICSRLAPLTDLLETISTVS